VSVCVWRLRVLDVCEMKLLRFCFKEVTFDPYLLNILLCYSFYVSL
jgi:hypothetical protein